MGTVGEVQALDAAAPEIQASSMGAIRNDCSIVFFLLRYWCNG